MDFPVWLVSVAQEMQVEPYGAVNPSVPARVFIRWWWFAIFLAHPKSVRTTRHPIANVVIRTLSGLMSRCTIFDS